MMGQTIPGIDEEFDRRVEQLGFEVVELEWAGSRARPILRLRVDRPDSEPGRGVTVDDCARISRELEPWLDGLGELSERYTLEVSSPGIERPLLRRRDFVRFRGFRASFRFDGPPEGFSSSRMEGTVEDVEEGPSPASFRVRIGLGSGEELQVDSDRIVRAHLLWDWEDGDD
ncbi:MAG: ribosome maturation factor RimP [Gemmatimonadales bacterium]|nr:MAG: ribosome maturation factor RimP [Gemmatimonadales bacterium]